jgi:tRNA dimethylallyltransferase
VNIEIVGCDAVQVYRGLDAASAKPSVDERAQVPHHGVDVADPRASFSLADWVQLAEEAVREITRRGKVPVVVGGTGLYLRGLLRGIIPAPARNEALRARLRAMASRYGTPALHRWLKRLDPVTAGRLAERDSQRIVRALEIVLSGERPWSERLATEGTWRSGRERYDAIKIGLDMDREVLKTRLRSRVDGFFDAGLVDEVRLLRAAGVPDDANAFKAIGYREVLAALQHGGDPEATREDVYRRTRDYAKRQRTWFRKEPGIFWLDASEGPGTLSREIADRWSRCVHHDTPEVLPRGGVDS